jgi:ParB family chromosome partitioning protein
MTARSKVRNIPLRQLALSPANVRRTPAAADDAALEASIRAKGILQNLIVHPAPIDGNDVYLVDAGGRRLRILQKLAAEGVIDADHPVPCKVEKPEDAVETIEAVALRFGTSERAPTHSRI